MTNYGRFAALSIVACGLFASACTTVHHHHEGGGGSRGAQVRGRSAAPPLVVGCWTNSRTGERVCSERKPGDPIPAPPRG